MKKVIYCFGIIFIVLAFVACGEKQSVKTENNNASLAVSNTIQSNNNTDNKSNGIDVDLTKLSSTMVYSEVYNMTVTPGNYLGQTVKMKGTFAVYKDETTGKMYYACIIADATACCSQGIEFVLKNPRSYPDEYPEVGSEITVTGTFDTYEENGYPYYQLKDATLES